MTQADQVIFDAHGTLRRIVLNRPHAINALTTEMVEAIDEALAAWAVDDAVSAVAIEGAGERGLCAGGDVVKVRELALAGADHRRFFVSEYAMNAKIAAFPKPLAVFQDGLVLGGGVGVSAHAGLRVVTPRTKVGMPETIIGFFPDVGALHLLVRAPGETGTHVALTGASISGADAIHMGLADGMIAQDGWPALVARLAEDPAYHVDGPDGSTLDTIDPGPSELARSQSWIDECYAGSDAAVIVERLRDHDDPRARDAGALLEKRSPLAVCATLEGLRRAASMHTVEEVLAQDIVLASAMALTHDFAEGVRAQLVDKDRDPKWSHASVADVSRAEVEALFA